MDQFKQNLRSKLVEAPKSSLVDEEKLDLEDQSPDTPLFLERVSKMLSNFASDDMWYELYKSVTSEKDMAEKD